MNAMGMWIQPAPMYVIMLARYENIGCQKNGTHWVFNVLKMQSVHLLGD